MPPKQPASQTATTLAADQGQEFPSSSLSGYLELSGAAGQSDFQHSEHAEPSSGSTTFPQLQIHETSISGSKGHLQWYIVVENLTAVL